MNSEAALIIHSLMSNKKVYKKLTGNDITTKYSLESIKTELDNETITSAEIIAIAKAVCKGFETVCPYIDKM